MIAGPVLFLLAVLGAVGLVSLAFAYRFRLSWRIAMRNVRRGRWRTVLVVFGLLVATTIVSGSLVIGDTVDAVNVHFTYIAYGSTDEAIYNDSAATTYSFFALSVASALSENLSGNREIAGITPEIVSSVSVLDQRTHVPEPGLNLIGAELAASGPLGSFTPDSGGSLAGPSAGQVFLDDQAASDLNASVGDAVALYGERPVLATVGAIVRDDTRGGFLNGGNVFVPLATAQALENVSSASINFIAVTNAGSLQDGVALSDSVSRSLNATLEKVAAPTGLVVHELLKEALAQAESAGSGLTTLFLVLGLFSIIAGAMLIIGIFVMIAEERKGEMGMLRAIGLTRPQLVLVYYFEGLAYSAGSAFAGTLLGVGVGYLLTLAFATVFSGGTVTSGAILDSFTASTSSLVTAYVVGFLLTLIAVSAASARVSRLNIVRAIRSMPEPTPTVRLYTYLAYIGAALALLGALLYARTYSGTSDVSLPLIGGALLVFGVAFIGSRFVPNRAIFTAAGAALLVWGGAVSLRRLLLGTEHTGTIFVVFAEGILLVLGALLVYAFNAHLVVNALTWLTRGRPRTVPIVRIGLSYPSRKPFRTAVNLAIFSLVIFTIVAVASFGASVSSGLASEVRAQSGGYTYFGYSQNPIPDLPGQIAANATLAPLFTDVVPLVHGGVVVNGSGFPSDYRDGVYAAPTNASPSQDFYTTNAYNFTSSWHDEPASEIFSMLATNASVVIVDAAYRSGGVSFGFGPPHPSVDVGGHLVLTSPVNGVSVNLTVIGILSESFVSGAFVNPHVLARLGFSGSTVFLISTSPGTSETRAAQLLKTAFFPYGLIVLDFAEILRSSVQSVQAIVGLLEIFVALGLAVGIAGMGIVALRAVVERRTEIGMLRATGQTQSGILKSFLLEYSYIALLGIGIGTVLGILLDSEASAGGGGGFAIEFTVPWANILTVVVVAYALTIAAIAGPSFKASRLPPAEAVRYSE